jgi:hypothetical protein
MSLVFLKNDDTTSQKNGRVQKPYRFSNFLTHPLKLPQNSQVALVNASFTLNEQVNLDNNQAIYALTGSPVLNMPYKIEMLDNDLIDDWTQFFNELGEEITEMNPDNNYMYNITQNQTVQPPQNAVPPLNPESRTQVTTPQGGLNWYLQNSGKSGLRVTQQADLMNDVFYQNFTSVMIPQDGSPAQTTGLLLGPKVYQNPGTKINSQALNDLGSTIQDSDIIENTEEALNWLALGDLADYQTNPWVPRYTLGSPDGAVGGYILGTAEVSPTPTNWLNVANAQSYYNTQFLWNDRLGNIEFPIGETIDKYYDFYKAPESGGGRDYGWAIQANKMCIKRAVGNTTPDIANNTFASGHQHIGQYQSGGYVVMGMEVQNDADALTMYNAGAMGSSDLAGCIGSAPFFAGVIPSACLYDREDADENVLGDTASVYDFLKKVDINAGDDNEPDGQVINKEMFDRNNAQCRYLFGVKLGFAQASPNKVYLQAQCLKPNRDGGSMAESLYINVNQALIIPSLAQGTNTACKPHFQFEPSWAIGASPGPRHINTFAGSRSGVNMFLRFRWDTPYTMVCEFILADKDTPGSYNPATDEPFLPWDDSSYGADGNKNPLVGWCKLASMNSMDNELGDPTGEKYLIPTSYGDIIPVSYHTYTKSFTPWKGYFANLQSGISRFPDSLNNQSLRGFRNRSYWKNDSSQFKLGMLGHSNLVLTNNNANRTSMSLVNVGITTNGDLADEGFDSEGRIKKEFNMLCLATSIEEDTEYWVYSNGTKRFTKGDPIGLAHGLAWGLQTRATGVESTLSFNIDGDPGTDYKILTWDGVGKYINNVEVFSNHIQILNLPIQSANGVRSTQNKTIYIVPVFQDGQNQGVIDGNVTNSFAFSPPNLIWVDLNNYQEIDLNKIDILITDDNNEEQRSLSNKTDVTLIFRQKGKGDIGYLPINIDEPDIRKKIKEETKKNLVEY